MKSTLLAVILVGGAVQSSLWSPAARLTSRTQPRERAMQGAQGNAAQVERLLTDQQVWGPDAFAVFSSLQAWQNVGENAIEVFPDRVLGAKKADAAADIAPEVDRVNAQVKQRAQPRLRPEFQSAYRDSLARRTDLNAAVEKLTVDDSFRLTLKREGGQFLKSGVTMQAVRQRYGNPERTTTEVVQAKGDRRPAIYTIHSYANGAVQFVESDMSLTPGAVDHVVVSVPAVAARLF